MQNRNPALLALKRKVSFSLQTCFCLVSLVLIGVFTALASFGYHERAKLSLMTYARLSTRALEETEAQTPPGMTYLASADFAMVGVTSKRTVSGIEYSGEENFLNRSEAQDLLDHLDGPDGERGRFLYHARITDQGGYLAVMDLSIVRSAMKKLLACDALLFLVLWFLFRLLARHLASRIVQPAEETFQRQERFAADCSHELKTPLAAIRANADLIEAEHGPSKELEAIQQGSEEMSGLIQQLLTLSKLNETDERASYRPLDLAGLVEATSMVMDALLEEKHQKLETHLEPVTVRGSKRQLQQLVSILLENAADHAAEGDVVTVSVHAGRKDAVLEISNPSPELDERQLAHLFDRFYQAGGSSPHTFGLGLAIAKSITESHQGTIEAVWGNGRITFRVSLPQA